MKLNSLTSEERENITSNPSRQNEAYQVGAYDYLSSIHMAPRYGTIAAYISALNVQNVLDVGCGVGNLRMHLQHGIHYCGIDISQSAIEEAMQTYRHYQNTKFECIDFMDLGETTENFDCIIWAGIGMGFADPTQTDILSWQAVINKIIGMASTDFFLILECISNYENYIKELSCDLDLISVCNIMCKSSEVHSYRHVCVIRVSKL